MPSKRIVAIALCLALMLTAALAWAAAPTNDPPRIGYDPLSLAEQDRAREIALGDAAVSVQLADATHIELLLIERHQEPKQVMQQGGAPRRADVYLYRYDADQLIYAIVDLHTARVDNMTTTQDVQLPLTQAEATRAVQLVLGDPQAGAALRAQFQQISGQALRDATQQLRVHALIFRADAMPRRADARACGIRRCAQLMIATQDDILINLLPIVDLSRGKLIELGNFIEE